MEFTEGHEVMNFVYEEKYITFLFVAIDNDWDQEQILDPDLVQEDEDNIPEPSYTM